MSEAGGISQIYKDRIQIAAVVSHKTKSGSSNKVFIYLITKNISYTKVVVFIWCTVVTEAKRRSGNFSDTDKTRAWISSIGIICLIIVVLAR
ncbi:MAG: hypothetical protein H6R35_775 [Bacteroidetes bacterium]|nr:hypothetical protein [Bacteroidota bacterium]